LKRTNNFGTRSPGIPIGNAILIGEIGGGIEKLPFDISVDSVIDAGATGLHSLTKSPEKLRYLQDVYSDAVSKVMIFLVAIICISVPTALGMKWLNIKKVSIQLEEEKRIEGRRAPVDTSKEEVVEK